MQPRGLDHATVVRDDRLKLIGEAERGRQVNGVERSDQGWVKLCRAEQNFFVDRDQHDAAKQLTRRLEPSFVTASGCSKHFGSEERGRGPRVLRIDCEWSP